MEEKGTQQFREYRPFLFKMNWKRSNEVGKVLTQIIVFSSFVKL